MLLTFFFACWKVASSCCTVFPADAVLSRHIRLLHLPTLQTSSFWVERRARQYICPDIAQSSVFQMGYRASELRLVIVVTFSELSDESKTLPIFIRVAAKASTTSPICSRSKVDLWRNILWALTSTFPVVVTIHLVMTDKIQRFRLYIVMSDIVYCISVYVCDIRCIRS